MKRRADIPRMTSRASSSSIVFDWTTRDRRTETRRSASIFSCTFNTSVPESKDNRLELFSTSTTLAKRSAATGSPPSLGIVCAALLTYCCIDGDARWIWESSGYLTTGRICEQRVVASSHQIPVIEVGRSLLLPQGIGTVGLLLESLRLLAYR